MNYSKLLLLATGMLLPCLSNAQTGIGTVSPDASTALDVSATAKGFLVPRLTMVQRNAIASPATSLLIYQKDNTPGYYYNSGTPAVPAWIPFYTPQTFTTGAYIQNQYTAAQTANAWISGEIKSGAWFRNSTTGTGIYNEANAMHLYSEGGMWTMAQNTSGNGLIHGLLFRNGIAGTKQGSLYSDGNGFGLLSEDDMWKIRVSAAGIGFSSNGALGGWNELRFEPSTEWGDGLTYGTLGRGSSGVMLSNPHITWSPTAGNAARLRYGRVGGIVSGAYWDAGLIGDDAFRISRNSAGALLTVLPSGNVGVGGVTNPGVALDAQNGSGLFGKLKFYGYGTTSNQGNDVYGIYQEAGAWSFPYPDLNIRYETGIKYTTTAAYGGHTFWTGNDGSSNPTGKAFSVGEGDTKTRVYGDPLTVANTEMHFNVLEKSGNAGAGGAISLQSYYNGGATPTTLGIVNSQKISGTASDRSGQVNVWAANSAGTMVNAIQVRPDIINNFLPAYYGDAPYVQNALVNVQGGRNAVFASVNAPINVIAGIASTNNANYGGTPVINIIATNGKVNGVGQNRQGVNSSIANIGTGVAYATGSLGTSYNQSGTPISTGVSGTIWAAHPAGEVTRGGYFENQLAGGNDWALYSVGRCFISAGTFNSSDERLKRDIVQVTGALSVVDKLRPVSYFYDRQKYPNGGLAVEKQWGFLAQEVEKILPEAVVDVVRPELGYGTFKAMNYGAITPILVAAMKEQQIQIVALKAENDSYKTTLKLLNDRLTALEAKN